MIPALTIRTPLLALTHIRTTTKKARPYTSSPSNFHTAPRPQTVRLNSYWRSPLTDRRRSSTGVGRRLATGVRPKAHIFPLGSRSVSNQPILGCPNTPSRTPPVMLQKHRGRAIPAFWLGRQELGAFPGEKLAATFTRRSASNWLDHISISSLAANGLRYRQKV